MPFGTKLYSFIDPFSTTYRSIRNAVFGKRKYLSGIVLDAGCGASPYRHFIKCDKYIGLDIKGDVDIRGSILDIPLKSNSVDSVLCTEVLEHVPSPGAALKELNRVMRKGGYLVLTTPFMLGVHGEPHDFYRYTRFGLKHLLESSGFKIISIEEHSSSFQAVCAGINSMLHKTFVNLGKARFILGAPLVLAWLFFSAVSRLRLGRGRDALGYICVARKIGH